MTEPVSVATSLRGRLIVRICIALIVTGIASGLPSGGNEVRASDEWQYAGFRDNTSSGRGVMGATPAPPIRSRDMRLFADTLRLDAEQIEILLASYEDFAASFLRASVLYEEQRGDARRDPESTGDWTHNQQLSKAMHERFEKTSAELEDRLLADIRLMLRPEQIELWDRLERERRRTKTLASYASYPDERFDLAACVHALDMTRPELDAIEPLLEEYRARIDGPLVSRNRQAERVARVYSEYTDFRIRAHQSGDEAMHEEHLRRRENLATTIVKEGLALRRACARVRAVNASFKPRIEEQLPERVKEKFREITTPETPWTKRAFEHFARAEKMLKILDRLDLERRRTEVDVTEWGGLDPDRMEMMLRAVRTAPALTEEQLEQIAVIRADWNHRSEAIYSRYAAPPAPDGEPDLIELPTPGGTLYLQRAWISGPTTMLVEEDKDHPGWKAMSRLDQEIVDRLREVLTIEQRALFSTM